MAVKMSKIQKVRMLATFLRLETTVIDIFLKFVIYVVQDASKMA